MLKIDFFSFFLSSSFFISEACPAYHQFTRKSIPFSGYEALYVSMSKATFVSVFTSYARSCRRSTSRHHRPQNPASFWRLPLLVSCKVLTVQLPGSARSHAVGETPRLDNGYCWPSPIFGSERYSRLYVRKVLQPRIQAIDFHRRWCTATHPWCDTLDC